MTTLAWFGGFELLDHLVLDSWNPIDLTLSTLLHADFLHVLFNMLFLWVFGNAICSKFGNLKFLLIFFGGALVSSVVHLIMDGNPSVGASGAINAVIGVFLVLYPINKIHCFYWIFVMAGNFSIKAYWLIGFWFAADLYGAFFGNEPSIAFWAHIGGFVAGLAIGFFALSKNWVQLSIYDNATLLDIILQREPEEITFSHSEHNAEKADNTTHASTETEQSHANLNLEELAAKRKIREGNRPERKNRHQNQFTKQESAQVLKLKSYSPETKAEDK